MRERKAIEMSRKIAMITQLPELQECTNCHCFSQNGYILRDRNMARFVDEECYETTFSTDYPLATKVVELDKNAIEQIAPDGKKPGFHAGYLMGKKEVTDTGYKIVVEKLVDSVQTGKGTANFFNKDDVMNLRKISRADGISIVGLYRTSPSGSPDFNLLDNKTLDDMLMDIIYMIIGGNSEIQIAIKDKHSQLDEIGVILT